MSFLFKGGLELKLPDEEWKRKDLFSYLSRKNIGIWIDAGEFGRHSGRTKWVKKETVSLIPFGLFGYGKHSFNFPADSVRRICAINPDDYIRDNYGK